jgi:hypothetical protein
VYDPFAIEEVKSVSSWYEKDEDEDLQFWT